VSVHVYIVPSISATYTARMKILVIGSCTGAKDDAGCPENAKLTEMDFDDSACLRKREKELAKWLRPAAEMYTGRQHTQMMDGVRLLRSTFGSSTCDVAILSAGYGLITEDRPIAPYNITFQGMSKPLIRVRGVNLGIPNAVRKLVADYAMVFFLLGDDYLRSAQPPLRPSSKQRFVAFGSPKLRVAPSADVVVIPSAQKEATLFNDGVVTLKGRMLHLLAAGLKQNPKWLNDILRDKTPETVLTLMNLGKRYA
jgi:hypothetical protein